MSASFESRDMKKAVEQYWRERIEQALEPVE